MGCSLMVHNEIRGINSHLAEVSDSSADFVEIWIVEHVCAGGCLPSQDNSLQLPMHFSEECTTFFPRGSLLVTSARKYVRIAGA